jgi:hypothetical protein
MFSCSKELDVVLIPAENPISSREIMKDPSGDAVKF